MKTYTPEELQQILALHAKWLRGETGGAHANLGSANLGSANLGSANLRYADLRYANLGYANLRSANLRSADLGSANLRYADLGSANLRYADLRYANLGYANLRSADLRYADLRYANLGYADLRSADLRSADLGYANLRSADLRSANLGYAKWNDMTQWPAITAFLLADWGTVSPGLCRDLMRYDAVCHPDPTAFDRWAKGGPCPYDNVRIGRAAHFEQRADLWSPGPVKPYDLFQRLLAEKLVKA